MCGRHHLAVTPGGNAPPSLLAGREAVPVPELVAGHGVRDVVRGEREGLDATQHPVRGQLVRERASRHDPGPTQVVASDLQIHVVRVGVPLAGLLARELGGEPLSLTTCDDQRASNIR